ncbi:MAG: HAMP domain-containing histidine kinase [Planctomycetes bacterium]|nr:HAMP domain-containing histidine kinase [Planctomycetota bacterium]MDA0947266.1 HAMP domain-containing sensor histidine kinase [Planctomycetota bacterium]
MSRANAPTPPVRPWRRLPVRFALLLVLLLLASFFAGPSLQGLGEALLEQVSPLPDPPAADERDEPWLEGILQEPYVDLLHVPADESSVIHRLVNWAEPNERGLPVPPDAAVEQLTAELAVFGQAFAWLDPEGRVLAATPALGLEEGAFLDLGALAVEAHLLEGAQREPEHPNVWQTAYPIHLGGELVGQLRLLTLGRPLEGFLAEGRIEDEPEPSLSPARRERRAALAAGIELLLFVLVAVIGSVSLSRLVTRRLSDLVTHAAVPLDEVTELEDPAVQGQDEIALLAGALRDLRRRARDLIASLTEQDAERRRWIALVSHDLRTPLTALTTCLETALVDLEQVPASPERGAVVRRMQLALTDAQRLRTLTDDLLDFARLDTEKALVLEPVPPGELARQAAAVMQGFADQLERQLEVEIDRGLPTLDADGGRLMRALENLIRNGLEHAHARVRLKVTQADESEVVFVISDDGPGLELGPDGEVDWEALAQRKQRPDSAGLGLAVVRRVAAAHGGRLEAGNGATGGARLALHLPTS